MYEVDERDRVIKLAEAPQSSVGAPLPLILADEFRVILAYYIQERDPNWDGTTIRIVSPDSADEPIAILGFNRCKAHMFGPPNDEAFRGHPLAGRGLRPYAAFRIENSSWIRKLERMGSVHNHHRPERFWKLQHIIFAFHDSTFECVCDSFDVNTTRGSLVGVIPEMSRLLVRRQNALTR